jgi:hypothetical protein
MAGIRDPAFWKRFSTAVHRDEEHGPEKSETAYVPFPSFHAIPSH